MSFSCCNKSGCTYWVLWTQNRIYYFHELYLFMNKWHLRWWNLLNDISQETKWSCTHNFPKTCTNSLWSSTVSLIAKILIILSTWRHVNQESHVCTAPFKCCSVGSPRGQISWPNSLTISMYFSNVLWCMVVMLLLGRGNVRDRTMKISNTSRIYSPYSLNTRVL